MLPQGQSKQKTKAAAFAKPRNCDIGMNHDQKMADRQILGSNVQVDPLGG